jgi:hypothetical protein
VSAAGNNDAYLQRLARQHAKYANMTPEQKKRLPPRASARTLPLPGVDCRPLWESSPLLLLHLLQQPRIIWRTWSATWCIFAAFQRRQRAAAGEIIPLDVVSKLRETLPKRLDKTETVQSSDFAILHRFIVANQGLVDLYTIIGFIAANCAGVA